MPLLQWDTQSSALVDDMMWAAVRSARVWLDAANGAGLCELTCRILKVTEAAGEVAGAWIGVIGQNPRKGVTHTQDNVAAELVDVSALRGGRWTRSSDRR